MNDKEMQEMFLLFLLFFSEFIYVPLEHTGKFSHLNEHILTFIAAKYGFLYFHRMDIICDFLKFVHVCFLSVKFPTVTTYPGNPLDNPGIIQLRNDVSCGK